MDLLRSGLASATLTLCAVGLCALLWLFVSPAWPVFLVGWALGLFSMWLAWRLNRWWAEV